MLNFPDPVTPGMIDAQCGPALTPWEQIKLDELENSIGARLDMLVDDITTRISYYAGVYLEAVLGEEREELIKADILGFIKEEVLEAEISEQEKEIDELLEGV